MSPRAVDPSVRDALVEAAARLIAEREPLTTRRLASEVGASTMAVYTHFGSLDEVRRAVRRAGFERLRDHMDRTAETDDPVADVAVLGWAYCVNAIRNPHLYRVMFMEAPLDERDAQVGLETFERLVAAVRRCIDAGRFRREDPWRLATQMWAMVHGAAALHLAGMLDESDVLRITTDAGRAFVVDFGDDADEVRRSLDTVARRITASDWEVGAEPPADTSRPV